MPTRMNDSKGGADPLAAQIRLDLSRMDMALIIDALLQAEMTLPLIDRRYRALKAIESLRAQQLSLANRLEDLMADSGAISEVANTKSRLEQDGADRSS